MKRLELFVYFVITGMLEILDIVCENVTSDWKSLAKNLKLDKTDVRAIDASPRGEEDKCWQVRYKCEDGKCLTERRRGQMLAGEV